MGFVKESREDQDSRSTYLDQSKNNAFQLSGKVQLLELLLYRCVRIVGAGGIGLQFRSIEAFNREVLQLRQVAGLEQPFVLREMNNILEDSRPGASQEL